jgi:hypothetical protein
MVMDGKGMGMIWDTREREQAREGNQKLSQKEKNNKQTDGPFQTLAAV